MGKHHPFQFGLNATSAASREDWTETARKAEELGYHSLLVSDHLGNLGPIAAIAAAAAATTTLRIGSLVFGNDFRHPVQLAQEAATLDLLSAGRLELGLGTGWMANDYVQSGIPFDRPGVRVNRLEEAVQIVKGFFGDEPFTFEGEHYRVHNLVGAPDPVQRPHPPIILGGGARRTLSLAAREANIVSVNIKTTAEGGLDFSSVSAAAADQKLEWVRQAAGDRFDDLILNLLVPVVAVTDSPRQTAQAVIDGMVQQYGAPRDALSVDQLLESPSALIGTVDQIAETLQARRERYGFSYITIFPPMEPFAPVVQRLAGS